MGLVWLHEYRLADISSRSNINAQTALTVQRFQDEVSICTSEHEATDKDRCRTKVQTSSSLLDLLQVHRNSVSAKAVLDLNEDPTLHEQNRFKPCY